MPSGQLPSGTVTFLFTDIEGSTRLWDSHPDVMGTALARHDALIREAAGASNGYVFKTIGDAFCVAYATAPEALEGAVRAQTALASEPWGEEAQLKVRVSLHTGAVERRDDDYFGQPLNRVARLLSAAHGGQTLISQATFELIRDSLPKGVNLVDLGIHQLKDLSRPEHVYQLCHPGLQSEFPSLRTLSTQPNNLPLQLTSFIGRDEEVALVQRLFQSARLVTLTGSGGSGKTRLSLQVAADRLDAFLDGVWLVEFASLVEPSMLDRAVADVLSVPENQGQSLARSVADFIGHKAMLLIFDNCEHLIGGCAKLADGLLRACPNVRILATSREPLGITGESAFRVPPLSVPDPKVAQTPASLSQFDAVRLFIDRAMQAEPTFAVSNDSAPAVASLCCRLDGIPLAIELAAARVRSLPVEQIDSRLDQRFRLLTGGSRAALPRQQTLRSLIDWSYDLLLPKEKLLLQRLSVFAGGWTLDTAEAVCADEETEGWEVADMVLALVDKSLAVAQEQDGAARFCLLESIREYARERLEESGGLTTYRDRHLQCFLAMSAEARPNLRGPEQKRWLERLEAEIDNFRAALAWGIGTVSGLSMAGDLWRFWLQRGHFSEGRALLMQALARNPNAEPEDRARALNGAGVFAEYQGDYDEALALHRESLEISRSRGARWLVAMSTNNIGNVYATKGDYETAAGIWEEALDFWKELEAEGNLDDVRGLAATLDNLGNVAMLRGELDDARRLYEEGLSLRRTQGNLSTMTFSLLNLAYLSFDLGNVEEARTYLRESLEVGADIRDKLTVGHSLFGLARITSPASATKLVGKFEHILEELGIPLTEEEVRRRDDIITAARKELDESSFRTVWAEGRSMTLEDAVTLGLSIATVQA